MNNDGSPDVTDAIYEIKNDAQYKIGEEGLSTLVWLDGNPTNITNDQINSKLSELQTAFENNEYARKRSFAYPPFEDFIEAYCEKEIGGNSTKWDAYVIKYNKVREDNPKE